MTINGRDNLKLHTLDRPAVPLALLYKLKYLQLMKASTKISLELAQTISTKIYTKPHYPPDPYKRNPDVPAVPT